MTDPWALPAGSGTAGGFETSGGFESAAQRRRRELRTRRGESWVARSLQQVTGLFRSDDYPRQLAEAAYGAQAAVTTGRRVAVVGSRGGAGKSTTAALLARVYAAMRQDAVAAVEAGSGPGTLGLRLGRPDLPPLDRIASSLNGRIPADFPALSAELAPVEPNLLAAGSVRNPQQAADGAALDAVSRAVSRYCPITVFDCGTGMEHPATERAIAGSHLALFVAPATVAGLVDAERYAEAWTRDSGRSSIPLVLLTVQTDADGPLDPAAEAARLRRAGHAAGHLGYDRHLAGGVELDLSRLARSTRLEATQLASQVLAGAIGRVPA